MIRDSIGFNSTEINIHNINCTVGSVVFLSLKPPINFYSDKSKPNRISGFYLNNIALAGSIDLSSSSIQTIVFDNVNGSWVGFIQQFNFISQI